MFIHQWDLTEWTKNSRPFCFYRNNWIYIYKLRALIYVFVDAIVFSLYNYYLLRFNHDACYFLVLFGGRQVITLELMTYISHFETQNYLVLCLLTDNWFYSLFPPIQYAFIVPAIFGFCLFSGVYVFSVYHTGRLITFLW